MRANFRILATTVITAMLLAACGGNEATTGPTQASTAASEAAAIGSAPAQAPSSTDAKPPPDISNVDWATVDLTTIDWATIDLREVDWTAISDNPTVSDLPKETIDLITSRLDPGSATLTVGDQTYEFDNFVCAFGHDATESSTYSFTTDSRGEFDGVRVQMQATIEDPATQGRYSGPDVIQRIDVNDISDFENPSVGWYMQSTDGIQVDGYSVTAEGTFDDQTTPLEKEQIPGTLEATCGDESRR